MLESGIGDFSKLDASAMNLVELDDCDRIPNQIQNCQKRNVIYVGAPGTGKSYNLNQDKDELLKNMEESFKHKFARKPEVIEPNMNALIRGYDELRGDVDE